MISGLRLILVQLSLIISISCELSTPEKWENTIESTIEDLIVSNETRQLISTVMSDRPVIDETSLPPSQRIPDTSETPLTTDFTTTSPPRELTTALTVEDMLITVVQSKNDISEETSVSTSASTLIPESSSDIGPSVTPPSIDSKDFLSEIGKTTVPSTYHWGITNIVEKKIKIFNGIEETDPATIEECKVSVLSESEDYNDARDSSMIVERAGDGSSDPTITNVTETSLTVAWKAPSSNITVLYYIVGWGRSGGSGQTECRSSNETFNHTITDLQPCTKYDIRVTPYTKNGKEQQRLASDSTKLKVEKDSLNLKVSASGTDWLKISWNLPNNDCVDKYIVGRCDSNNCTSVDVTETSYNATDLFPCTKYNFTVSVHGKSSVEYGSTSIDSETNFLQPQQPSPAWSEAGNQSLKVFWTFPIGTTCVKHYRVTLPLSGNSVKTQNITGNETLIDSLQSCRVYEITITPVTNYNESTSAVFQSNRTFPAVLNPPVLPRVHIATNHSIAMSWRVYTNDDNNCENTTLIFRCNFTQVRGYGYEGLNGTTEKIIVNGTKSVLERVQIDDLSPFTLYSCYASARNSQGVSDESAEVSAETAEEVPSPPMNLSSSDLKDTKFILNWKAPTKLPGTLVGFEIKLIIWSPNIIIPAWCEEQKETSDTISNINGKVFSYKYENAIPFSTHKTKIRAKTNAGWGNWSEEIFVETRPGAPGPVSFLNYSIVPNTDDPDILDFTLSWGKPCSIHGERIEYYNVTANGERRNYKPHNFTEVIEINRPDCKDDICTKKLKLWEEYKYVFNITGKGKDCSRLGEPYSLTAIFPAGIPPLPEENYTAQITIDPYKARRTTTTAAILLPVFSDTYGKIHCYAIIVAKSGYNNMTHGRNDRINGEWPNTPSWLESKSEDFRIPYQAIKFCDGDPSYIVDYGNLKAVKYILGDDTEHCPKLSSNSGQRSYCNGPLEPDTWYDVRMRAFTNGGYRDSTIFTVKTNAEMRVAEVIGIIFGILFLGILTTLMLLVRKCSVRAVVRRFLHSDMPGSPVPAPFTRRKFITHCQQLADNPGKLSNEFQLLQTLSVDLQMPTNAACLQANRKKNRYTDILPYDFSRVKLEQIDTDPNSDYINASFIKGCSGEEEYIACQGPKEETTYDFWRMIDQYDVKLIVMLTQLMEKNKDKCHQYFPTMKETFTYENMSIRCTTEFDYRTYTQRTLVLQKENEKRTITHLHFKDWPDHDVPEDFDPMINFCQIIRRYITANPGLAVVHCSAGIGRTGTLIAIDILLQHIKENRKLDVFGTVYRLRHHRINMVQRESQYAYIYNCIRQVLKNPYFSKTYKPPSVDPITDVNGKRKEPAITNLVSSLETLRYNTLDYPIHEIEKEGKSSTSSLDDSDESSNSFYENLQPINRSKSVHIVNEDPTVTEKLLDTSL
ncbi:tyrosine-protein phosphatase 10D isoform X2 [Diachasmimorpha longicaudata]|uniref:tyrosine-protein phosphatase 10D isoform X2 n=1 Tax=Diachasmimorpha longicaudata TaxID=58733 RepID=UPI0030B8F20E